MKWMKLLVLLGPLFFVGLTGCSDTGGGATGDQNDPATSGDDEAQMNEGAEDLSDTDEPE